MTIPHDTPSPQNGAGNASLVLGVTAIIFSFVPVIGEFVAIPAAVAAVVTGLIGFDRVDQGRATNRRDAIIGGSLGLLALLASLAIFAATHSSALS